MSRKMKLENKPYSRLIEEGFTILEPEINKVDYCWQTLESIGFTVIMPSQLVHGTGLVIGNIIEHITDWVDSTTVGNIKSANIKNITQSPDSETRPVESKTLTVDGETILAGAKLAGDTASGRKLDRKHRIDHKPEIGKRPLHHSLATVQARREDAGRHKGLTEDEIQPSKPKDNSASVDELKTHKSTPNPMDKHPLADFSIDALNNKVKFNGKEYQGKTLKESVEKALIQEFKYACLKSPYDYVSDMPEHENRTLILGILKPEREAK